MDVSKGCNNDCIVFRKNKKYSIFLCFQTTLTREKWMTIYMVSSTTSTVGFMMERQQIIF